jgi:hypothetical protein
MKTLIISMLSALALWGAVCGVVPVKPVVPVGCKDLVAECVCDDKGHNCKYVWKCVK